MKTFDSEPDIVAILEKTSALHSTAEGRRVSEGTLIKQAIREHLVGEALRDAPAKLEALIDGLPSAERKRVEAPLRAEFARRRRELLDICRQYKIGVDREYKASK